MAALAAVAFSYAAYGDTVIGVAVPSQGSKAEVGRAILAGAYKGSDGVNAIRLTVEDDQCTAEGGAAVAAKFVTLKVDAVVGHPCSNAAIAAAQVYAAAGIAFVAIGADHPDLTDKRAGPTIFRSNGRRDRQAADTVATFASALTGRRVAVINDKTAYARKLADEVAAGFKAQGVSDIVTMSITAGEKDYSALITQLAATRIEAIYFAGFPSEAILIMKGLLDANVAALLIGCDALDDPLIAAEAGHMANTAVMVATSDIAIIAHETAQLVRNWSPLKRYDGSVLPPFPVDKKGDRQVRSYHAINPITGKPFWPLF
jgi:branched-chain amino acid transport system substrate-binding protein